MILPLELHHLEDIITIENIAFSKPWTRKQIKSDVQNKMNSENWVYVIDGLVVGYIFGCIIYDEFHLNNIAVHKKFQCQHIGTL